jgi:two-component system, NarL family, response regulator NreC
MKTIRVLIADGHPMVRRGFKLVLANWKEWKICGEASTGAEAVKQAKALRPDVVVMDISLTEKDCFETIREIRNTLPEVGVLMFTVHNSRQVFERAMQAGAHAYVLKSDSDSTLVEGLEAVYEGKTFVSPEISMLVLEGSIQSNNDNGTHQGFAMPAALTRRQHDVLRLLVRGKNNKQIALDLGISPRTVEAHRHEIMNRLHLHNLSELVLYAIRNLLLDP